MFANVDREALVPRLILVCFIVYALVFYAIASAKAFEIAGEDAATIPELVNEEDMLAILRPDKSARCRNMKTFSTALSNHSVLRDPEDENSHVCMDSFPRKPSPDNCKVYSIDPHEDNVYTEMQLAKLGCRVHMITAQSVLNFGRLTKNVFYYPLHIVPQEENMNKGRDVSEVFEWRPEVGYYTIEDFIALMSHEERQLSLVRTYQPGSELRLISSLLTSPNRVWCQMPQLSMVIHLPSELTPETRPTFTYTYLLLRRLRSMGYRLVLNRPMISLKSDSSLSKSSLLNETNHSKLDKKMKQSSVLETQRFFVKELYERGNLIMEEERTDIKSRLAERYETTWLRSVNERC